MTKWGIGAATTSTLHQIAQQARRDRELRQREPGTRDAMHGGADALDFGGARRNPGVDRLRARDPIADHFGGEAALGLADLVERAVERQAVEIVGDLDAARRIGDAVELKERAGGEVS